ncbi:Glutaredoxin-related protein 5, mitochondrial [Sparganum proliferum]
MASRASQLFPMARLFAQSKACLTRTAAPFGGLSAATQRQSQQLARTCSKPSLLPSLSPLVTQCRDFADTLKEDTRERLNRLTKATRVVILMKGNPSQPRCGFSNAVCRILEAHGVLDKVDKSGTSIVSSFDVLEDNEIREGAKIFSDWPTFPQVYIDGEFVGGCDILLDMHRSGKLAAELNRLGIESKLSPEPPSSS